MPEEIYRCGGTWGGKHGGGRRVTVWNAAEVSKIVKDAESRGRVLERAEWVKLGYRKDEPVVIQPFPVNTKPFPVWIPVGMAGLLVLMILWAGGVL